MSHLKLGELIQQAVCAITVRRWAVGLGGMVAGASWSSITLACQYLASSHGPGVAQKVQEERSGSGGEPGPVIGSRSNRWSV